MTVRLAGLGVYLHLFAPSAQAGLPERRSYSGLVCIDVPGPMPMLLLLYLKHIILT